MKFQNDYHQKLWDSFGELSEKENGLPLIQNARGGKDCSVLNVGCVEVNIWQISVNDGVDSGSRELFVLV